MLTQSPLLQFVTGLPDSPKTEAKGMILVRGPWHETLSSPDLPFTLNRSISFPSVFKLWGLYVGVRLSFTFTYVLNNTFFFVQGKAREVDW